MRETKYMMSGGLAFSEDRDMQKLHRLSLKGWHVREFKFMGYLLERGESGEYIYSLDYRTLNKEEEAEYFDFFSSSGWTHVASEADTHLFRARPGTKPIYTDQDTTVEKYRRSSNSMMNLVPFIFLTVLIWLGAMFSSDTLNSILLIVAIIFTVIAIPSAWTVIATFNNKWKVEGRRGLVHLGRLMPILLLLIAVFILFFVEDTRDTVNILTSMMIGGIALPMIVGGFMSLYHKVAGKRH